MDFRRPSEDRGGHLLLLQPSECLRAISLGWHGEASWGGRWQCRTTPAWCLWHLSPLTFSVTPLQKHMTWQIGSNTKESHNSNSQILKCSTIVSTSSRTPGYHNEAVIHLGPGDGMIPLHHCITNPIHALLPLLHTYMAFPRNGSIFHIRKRASGKPSFAATIIKPVILFPVAAR